MKLTPPIQKQVLDLFSAKHYSLGMIGKEVGVSRQAIKKFLNKSGLDTSKANSCWIPANCKACNKPIKVQRVLYRSHKNHFCNQDCYSLYRRELDYKPWRQGQRIARNILRPFIQQLFGDFDFTVHHKDGDEFNNNLPNLIAFPNQSNHLTYHHKQKIVSILCDGAYLQ